MFRADRVQTRFVYAHLGAPARRHPLDPYFLRKDVLRLAYVSGGPRPNSICVCALGGACAASSFGSVFPSQRCTKTRICFGRTASKLVIRPMPDYSDKWTLKMPVRERRAFFRPFAYASSSTSNAHPNRLRQDVRRSGADFPPCCG